MPSFIAVSAVIGSTLAVPRTPSVPKSLRVVISFPNDAAVTPNDDRGRDLITPWPGGMEALYHLCSVTRAADLEQIA
jgi:hypothetical protein